MPAATYAILLGSKVGLGTPISLGSGSNTSGSSTVSMTTSVAVPAGALIVVATTGIKNSSIAVTSVSDGTNTYTLGRTSTYGGTTFVLVELWYCQNALAISAGTTITVTFNGTSSNGNPTVTAGYCTGVAGVSSLDKVNSGDSHATTVFASGTTGTLTQIAEVAFGTCGGYTGSGAQVSVTEGSGFTQLVHVDAGTRNFTHLAYQVVNSTSALNYQPSTNTNCEGATVIATFKGS